AALVREGEAALAADRVQLAGRVAVDRGLDRRLDLEARRAARARPRGRPRRRRLRSSRSAGSFAALASAAVTVARLRLAPGGETMFPPRAPFFLSTRGNLPVPARHPPRAHGPRGGP